MENQVFQGGLRRVCCSDSLAATPWDMHSLTLEIRMGLGVITPGATEKDWAIWKESAAPWKTNRQTPARESLESSKVWLGYWKISSQWEQRVWSRTEKFSFPFWYFCQDYSNRAEPHVAGQPAALYSAGAAGGAQELPNQQVRMGRPVETEEINSR